MAEFSFTSSNGKPFNVKGPEGFTRAQAEEVFKKQDSTGALVGFKPGDALSAATQAAAGLASAQALLQQAQGGLSGALGVLGAVAQIGAIGKALGAAGGALGGSLAATAFGLTGAVGPATSALSGAVSTVPGAAGAGAPKVAGAVIQGSTAVTSVQTINKTIVGVPVTNPINTAAFTKVAANNTSAVNSIGPMGVPEVNGVLAQKATLVDQKSNVISNTKGVGTFGLDAQQLENAGYVKPGIAAKVGMLDATDPPTLQEVLKSPAAWTGKDGIKSVGDLLANPAKQSQIQQDLMTKGVAGLGALGVPVDNLSSQGIAGMALNAAKSLIGAEAFVKGLPIPGDATGAIAAAFATNVRDAAFAVNLVNTKIPTAFKQQDIPVPKSDTVNRATLDAASNRTVGDDKVPVPSYSTPPNTNTSADYIIQANDFLTAYLNPIVEKSKALDVKIAAAQNQQTLTQAQYNALSAQRDAIRDEYNVNGAPVAAAVLELYNALPAAEQAKVRGTDIDGAAISAKIKEALAISAAQKETLYALSKKIEGRGAN